MQVKVLVLIKTKFIYASFGHNRDVPMALQITNIATFVKPLQKHIRKAHKSRLKQGRKKTAWYFAQPHSYKQQLIDVKLSEN